MAYGKVQERSEKTVSFKDKIHGTLKAYIVAHKILYQNQSLFLAFWLRKWHFFTIIHQKIAENGKKKKGDKKLKNDL